MGIRMTWDRSMQFEVYLSRADALKIARREQPNLPDDAPEVQILDVMGSMDLHDVVPELGPRALGKNAVIRNVEVTR